MTYSSQINTLFSGISDTSSDPPHNALAVGPSNVVTAEGSRVEWTDLSGGGGATSLQSIYQFYGSLPASARNSLFDPRAAYDSINQRYVVTADNIGSNGTISNIDIAVSKDSNPNDGWYVYSLNTSLTINGQLTAADQPTVSLDGANIYITAPQYNVNVSGFAGSEQWVIGDTAGAGGGIYNGGTMTVVANQLASPGQGIARVVAGNNGQTYYASAVNTGSQTLVTVQTYTLATNSFGPAATLSLGNVDQGGGGADFTAQQQGTSVLLDAGDGRIQNLAYANGFLYGVSEVLPVGSSTPQVHWFKIDVSNPNSPTLVAQGNVSGAAIGSGVATFDGSIAVDGAGDVIINFTASGPNMYPADYYAYMGATDPSASFSAPVLYQASTSFLANGDGGNVQRWGINSTAIADPNDPNSFWLSSEYVANGWWQTSVAQIAIQTPNIARTNEDTPVSGSLASLAAAGSVFTAGNFTSSDGAKVTIAADGSFTYDPKGVAAFESLKIGQTAVDRFSYTVTDGGGNVTTAIMMVDVGVVDSGPVVANFRSSAHTQTSFSGITDPNDYPPDNAFAVGPNNIVMAEGARVEWTDLSGGGGASSFQSIYQFYGSLPASARNSLFDPRAAYDSVNQRYVVTADNIGSNGTISNIDIAVSKDSNPNDGWYFYSLNTSLTINSQLTAADQPNVSLDGTNIYITAPQYNVNVSGFAGTEQWVIGDTAGAGGGIYNGGTMTVVANQLAAPGQGIARVVAGNNGQTYYASAVNTGSQTLVTVQTYTLATNSFGPTTTLSLGNVDQGGGGANFTAQQQGTSLLLDAGDGRIQNLAYANGFLYGVSEVKPAGSSTPQVHWFKIDVSNPNSPTLVAQGNVSGATIGSGVATFDGSIAVDGAGDVIINFAASGPNMYPADYYVSLGATDPAGSFSAPALYRASTGYFNTGNGSSVQRWGNNSTAIADPNNPHSFWLSGEYVANGWWQTSVAQVAIQTPIATSTSIDTPITGSLTSLASLADQGDTGDSLSFTAGTFTSSDGAKVTIAANGSYTYDPTGVAVLDSLPAGQSAIDGFTYTVTDNHGASTTGVVTVSVTARPAVTTIATSGTGIANGNGDLNAGSIVTLTVNFSAAVMVDTTGGSPALTLNDGGTATYSGGSGTTALTFSYTVLAGQNTSDLTVSSLNLNGSTVKDAFGNNANLSGAANYNPAGILQIDTVPTIASISTSGTGIANGNGDLNAGNIVTLTVNFSAAVTVDTTAGSPALALSDGGTATYSSGSGTTALSFSYTVLAGQNTSDLTVSSLNLNGSTVKDAFGNNTNLLGATNYNPAGILQIDTTAPTIASISTSGTGITGGNGDLNAGKTVTLTASFSETVSVNTAGGSPRLPLNDGGIAAYSGGSGTTALTFSYTVSAGQNTPDLAVSSLDLNGSTLADGAGNSADLSGATNYNPAGTLQIDTAAPTIASIATSGVGITNGNGDLNAGKTVTLTVNFSQAVSVNTAGGSPRLLLNDGGIATYSGGSGTTALTFSYTVSAGQNTPDLTISSLDLNGSTIADGAGNSADVSGATSYVPAGTLQIDTIVPTITSIATSGTGIANGNGDLNAGKTVTLTVNFSEAVTVNTVGGSPRLLLNDGGIATYSSGSGTAALTFSYTVSAGQNTPDLTVSSLSLNGSTITDPASNNADLSGAANYNPAGTLQIDTIAPTIASIATSGTGITNGNGDLNAGKTVTLTVNLSQAVSVNTVGGSPRLLLNDGGVATYSGGSGTTALTFSYTVLAGQNTADLKISSFDLNGSTIVDGAGNSANLSGATNYNPAGILQIDTSAPTIAINTIAGNNNINALTALTGFAVTGTTTNTENGQIVTVNIVNSQNVVVDSYSTSDQNNAWSVNVTSAQALALIDGVYKVTADVADRAGNLAPLATRSLTVEEDNKPEAPILTIANTGLTVQAGGSVVLGITATPIDSDDSVTVKIAGLPSYETITAPSGYSVSKALQSNGTYTWTVSETSSTRGKPLTGLTLTSSYTGTDHPVATLTVTASNTTFGESLSSPSQTMTVTDPPAITTSPTSNLIALFNQYAAWGFHGGRADAGEIAPAWTQHGGHDVVALLATPGHIER